MASLLFTLAALTGAVLGLPSPSPSDDPVRILPYWWTFTIRNLTGPGCPDLGSTDPFGTRPTYGSNTVDGSEIYYWHFAYPSMHASVGPGRPESSTWCETTLSYAETDKNGTPKDEPEYRLKLHKNGTEISAVYDLEEGVEAKWKFTYFANHMDEVCHSIASSGSFSCCAQDPNCLLHACKPSLPTLPPNTTSHLTNVVS